MPQNTNLNVSPYFDDFVDSKNYHKVLFKPGFPIQARELTTLQTILQDQVEKFGQHFFKEGSMVIPGGITYDSDYTAVKIDPNFLNIPVSSYTNILVDNKIEIKGETTGVEATVVNRLTSSESIDGFDTLYVKYTKSGFDGETKVFADGENLITLSSVNYANTSIAEQGQFARCIVSNSTSTGSALSVSEGVFFIRGFFVKNVTSTIILDQYTNTPSYRVGFLLKEEVVSPSLVNSDLYDNAKGFSNESAPGADRFKLSTRLHKKSLTNKDDSNFVELFRVENGNVEEIVTKTDYNTFAEELARRTYDESGDYYVRPFSLEVRESLNNRLGNKGIYFDTQTTSNGNAPGDDSVCLQISSGKAYVRGYEVDKISTTSLDVLKPRTTKTLNNQSVPIRVGTSIKVTHVKGMPKIGFSDNAKINLRDRRLSASKATTGSVIGDARVFDFNQKAVAGIGATAFDLKLYDIQLYTKIKVSNNETIAEDSYVKGKFSGSTGHAVSAVTDGIEVTLRDVSGEFQLNEPILINGIDSGNNITEIVDNNIESIKSVNGISGVNFAANTVLNTKKKVFNDGIELTVSGGNKLKSPQVADFRSQLHVGDIISYGTAGQNDPTFNRVTGVNQNDVDIASVPNVAGVCTGTVSNGTRSGLSVVIPTLNESDNPGLRVRLANDYVASMNVLDSSYITRKQFSNTASGNSVTFEITNLGGDTSELFFELFSAENYYLEVGNVPIPLFEPQVSVIDDLKKVVISGIPNGSAELTVAVRRSKLVSKAKSLVRCEDLTVSRSELSGSGIGSTSLSDGLEFSEVYGTRVQDEEISLNFPEANRILAIFESNDANDPELPTISVSQQSDTFIDNVLVGDQFVGAESGAVARVVVVAASQLSFVYENDNTFQVEENITLMASGIIAKIDNITIGDENIIDDYTLDNGHRDDFVDYARIVRKSDVEKPTRKLRIIFDRFSNDESSGNIETVNSYNNLDYSNDLPFVFDSYASDYIDFRPRVSPYNMSSTKSPFSYASRSFSTSGSETVVTNKTVVVDYSYYLGRIDRLYLSKEGKFTIKEGKPSRNPKAPLHDEGAFQVATISYPPYVRNASETITKTVPHKRYTMRDIGSLENRIKTLEEYTTLSLLESDTKNLSVKDPNTGLDKFKSGFYVDNFQSHKTHNLRGDSNFDIDVIRGECRPRSTERNISLVFETKSSTENPITTDYRFTDDFADSNITRGGPALTLNYTEVPFIDQQNATRVENLNPFLVLNFVGTLELTPSSDFWIEETVLPSQNIQVDSVFDGIADLLGVDDENGGMASSFWNSHETTWNGRDSATLVDEDIIRRQVLNRDVETRRVRDTRAWEITTTTTTDVRNTIRQTFEESGVEREFGLELSASEQVIDLGTKVVSMNVSYNVRSRNIEVFAQRLKPNTQFYVFMENTDLTPYAVPKFLPISMVKGTFAVNDIVESISQSNETTSVPEIKFRVATPNHKEGPYNNPIETITNLAYPRNTTLSSAYSSTSEVLNIDTADLSLENNVENSGYVFRGMQLVNADGSAEATVGTPALVSDEQGDLIFSLHIPDPKIASNPVFTTGNNTIRITTDSGNAAILDPGSSSAEAEYFSSGYQTNTQSQTLSIKQPQIERVEVGREDVTRQFNRTRTETVTEVDVDFRRDRIRRDPLAQSFMIKSETYENGIFITGGDLFFKTKDKKIPVTIQIRTMRDGSPTSTVVPFGETKIKVKDVKISDDGSSPSPFKFKTPVYLQSGNEYCIVLMAFGTLNYLAFINRMGETDLITQGLNATQPVIGSLFKSQNNRTWTASQYEDLKFKLNKAEFITNSPSSVLLYNSKIRPHHIKRKNPITAFSKRVSVKLGATTQTVITQGDKFEQTASGFIHTGKVFAVGGPIKTGGSSNNLTVVGTGVGLVDGSYTGIGFTSLTGFGQGATADVTVSSGAVTAGNIDIQNGGEGYAPGDLLMLDPLGSGSGVRVVVKSHVGLGGTNIIILDDVKNNFVTNLDVKHYPNGGGQNTIANADITGVIEDPIRDGYTMKVRHKNHGMHSNTNEVRIRRFKSDVKPTTLTQKIDDDTSVISLANATGFDTFEGQTVTTSFPGFVQIDKEVIKYTGVSGNTLTDISRAIDAGTDDRRKSDHKAKAYVFKYEFNGISLRKINKRHDIDPREKTFNSYHVKVSTASTEVSFNTTKSGGGNDVRITQNIPFEAIDPQITSITPTGTSISARIKTTSGTSLSGNEASFEDMGYETVALNKTNYFDTPRMVASGTNEAQILDKNKSLSLELTLSTNNKDVSPMINLDTANAVLLSNLVDDKVDNFETDSRTKVSGSDPNNAIYETKLINLEFVSNSLMVQFDGHREAEGDIRAFYKLVRGDGNGSKQSYVPFNANGLPDTTVKPNAKRSTFSEYKFTAENTPQFNAFMIKVVMTSTNQAKPPRLKNFRAIALRSFEIE